MKENICDKEFCNSGKNKDTSYYIGYYPYFEKDINIEIVCEKCFNFKDVCKLIGKVRGTDFFCTKCKQLDTFEYLWNNIYKDEKNEFENVKKLLDKFEEENTELDKIFREEKKKELDETFDYEKWEKEYDTLHHPLSKGFSFVCENCQNR